MKFEDKIEKLLSYAGNNNRYQYFALVVIFFLWTNCNFMAVVLPYLERLPVVQYTDKQGVLKNGTLDKEICNLNYTIIESHNYSWVQGLNINCDHSKTGLISSFTFIGNTAGGLLFAITSKFVSHKKNMIISSFLFCLSILMLTFCDTIKLYGLLLFGLVTTGIFCNFLCYSSLTVSEEIVVAKRRSIFGSIVNVGYTFCGLIYTLLFYLFKEWKPPFYVLIGLSMFWCIIIWIFIYDSPRYFIEHNKSKETTEILKGMAKFNGLSEQFNKALQTEEVKEILEEIDKRGETNEIKDEIKADIEKERLADDSATEDMLEKSKSCDTLSRDTLEAKKKVKSKRIGALALIKYPSIRYKFLLLCLFWLSSCGIYNGIAVDSKNLGGNFYVNQVILFATEAVSYSLSGYLIELKCLGRRGTIWGGFVITIVSLLISGYMKLSTIPQFLFNLFARFCISAIHTIYYTYSLELYPTPVRAIGFGINAGCGNGASILFPFIQEHMNIKVYNTIYAGLCVICGIGLFFMDETWGKPMVETIKELEEEDQDEEPKDNNSEEKVEVQEDKKEELEN